MTDGAAPGADPDLDGDEAERVRARLRRAGMLDESSTRVAHPEVSPEVLAAARRTAGQGRPLSLFVAVLSSAAALVTVHGLRSLEAVQLASVWQARRADPHIDTFACFDLRLAAAVAAESFSVVPA